LRLRRAAALAVLLASSACATPYAYTFSLVDSAAHHASVAGDREVLEDADVRAEFLVDPLAAQAILLDLTNKTDQVLQVQWTQITMTGSDGSSTTPRPDVDLGWIEPGNKKSARLVPFALPREGSAAFAEQGHHFALEVPMVVRRELKRYRFDFLVQVKKLESH
jgi:hypothetical protein